MELESLLKLISDYGLALVISAGFLIYIRSAMKSQQEKFDIMFQKLLNPTANTEKEIKKERAVEVFERKVDETLLNLMYTVDAGRAFYIRFHNGSHDISGISLMKMSMTNEAVRSGIFPTKESFTNQFRYEFEWALKYINEDDEYYLHDVDMLKENNLKAYEFMKQRSVKSSRIIAIKYMGRTVGVLGIEYTKPNVTYPCELLIQHMDDAKLIIETAIDLALQNND